MTRPFLLVLGCVCAMSLHAQTSEPSGALQSRLQQLSDRLSTAEKNDDIKGVLAFYEEDAISMPDYQPMLRGTNEIGPYYTEIFRRQKVSFLQRQTKEVIPLGKTIIEIGTFKKKLSPTADDTSSLLQGKYCHIWHVQADSSLKIKREISGFFHPVARPEAFVVGLSTHAGEAVIYDEDEIPVELRAYNALMEKYVKNGEGALRSQFFCDDGQFMPFAHPTVSGIQALKPYLVAYDTHGEGFRFDSISVYTYDFEYFQDHVLEYPKFKVKWSTPTASGKAEGKNVRIWKRQKDGSLKLYVEISTHDHLK